MTRILRLVLLLALAAAPLSAQGVRGALTESRDGAAVAGALVVLLDAEGRARTEVLTGADGRFLLRAPGPGRYTLRADRIGYASTRSAPFDVGERETVEVHLSAPSRMVMLEALTVTATARCTLRPSVGAETAVLWEEARKALRSSAETRRQYPYRYRVRRTFREMDAPTGIVRGEETRERDGFSERPFAAVSPAALAERGYVEVRGDTALFNAPDAEVLLSEEFQDAHCFRMRAPGAGQEGLIGLAFEPVARSAGGPRTPGIRGVLWLDRATAELRRLEYTYVNLPPRVPEGVAGGTVEFQRLPNGAWIVPAWRIRMPAALMHRAALSTLPAAGRVQVRPGPPTVVAEEMGEVLEIRTREGEVVPLGARSLLGRAAPEAAPPAPADEPGEPEPESAGDPEAEAAPSASAATQRIVGRLLDAGSGRPVAGAEVRFSGGLPDRVTDARGEFVVEAVAPGSYEARIHHERYGAAVSRIVVGEDGGAFELRLPRRTIALEAITVTAERVPRDDYARTRARQSGVITREQIETRIGVARNVADLVGGIPGIRVSQSNVLGGGDATAAICIEPTYEAARRGCAAVGVVLNDIAQPFTLNVIRDLPAAEIESVEYIRPIDAEGMYGHLGRNGVLRIYTVGYRRTGP